MESIQRPHRVVTPKFSGDKTMDMDKQPLETKVFHDADLSEKKLRQSKDVEEINKSNETSERMKNLLPNT